MRIGVNPVPDSALALLTRVLQVALLGIIAYGGFAGNMRLFLNGVLVLGLTVVPLFINRRYDQPLDPRLTLWIAIAAVVHTLGFLGPYGAQSGLFWWYDKVAHAISASFIAGVSYALIVALDRNSDRLRFPSGFRFMFTLCFIMAFGVAWEIIEFAAGQLGAILGGGEALVQYGIEDIVLDLVFNTLAAAAVALWGTQYFRNTALFLSRLLPQSRNP